MLSLMKTVIKWLGIAFGCLVLWVVVSSIELPISEHKLYGTYKLHGEVLELRPDGTYRFVARHRDDPCVSCQGHWKYLSNGYGGEWTDSPMILLDDFVDYFGNEPRSQEKWPSRFLIRLGDVSIWEAPEVYAEKVSPEAFVPCGQGSGEESGAPGP